MKTMKRLGAGLLLALTLSACTPAQFQTWMDLKGFDKTGWTDAHFEYGAAVATAWWANALEEAERQASRYHEYDYVLSDAALGRLRQCESGGNYSAIGGGGLYRGAYQFHRTTWNSVASRFYPELVGVDPAYAAPVAQDAMARALFMIQGRSPWPICGQRI
ncbi:MAG: transglycosylase family protein [Acidimicrobiales bacterium]|jgi:hypothetical protein|nr:transglycosylase family protein [Acidimicrobiales bacterium]